MRTAVQPMTEVGMIGVRPGRITDVDGVRLRWSQREE